jgi:AcrR family transcriptional regulator
MSGGEVHIRVSENLYVKDPQATLLGRNILTAAIILLEQEGFEQFTFAKAAKICNTTEASIYRYFENKHKLLLYLTEWYWGCISFRIDALTKDLRSPLEKLKVSIQTLTDGFSDELTVPHMDGKKLHTIIIAESAKSYLTRNAREEALEGSFDRYRGVCKRIGNIMANLSPEYPFVLAFSSTLIETVHEQLFFSGHIPGITEIKSGTKDLQMYLLNLCQAIIQFNNK